MRELKQDIADVVWTISQADWGETTTTEDRERMRLIFTNKLLALFTAETAAMREALRWCSGSADFQEGGQARKGWLKICKPLL